PDSFGPSMTRQLDGLNANLKKLAERNRPRGLTAVYHTWNRPGAVGDIATAIWDIVEAIKDIDPDLVAIHFDILHIIADDPHSGWKIALRYGMPNIRGIGAGDMVWGKDPANSQWKPQTVQVGTGMVPWDQFFKLLLHGQYSGPVELQIEY